MSDKILSIIVPSYNMEAYLPKCLGSLVVDDKELLQKLDVIVVNDGSTDRTSDIAHEFEMKYPGVFSVIDKINGNYGSCINVALKQLCGKFVKVLDADDEYDGAGLTRFLRILNALDADLVLTDWLDIYSNGSYVRKRHNLHADELFSINRYLEKCAIPFHAGITYKSDIFRQFNYSQLEGVSYTDLEWTVLPLTMAKSVIYIPEIVYRYTVTRAGQTSDSETKRRNYRMILDVYLDLVRKYEKQRTYVEPEVIGHLDRLIALKGESFFRHGHILRANVDFRRFDTELEVMTPTIHSLIASCREGHSRFNFVKFFRRNRFLDNMIILTYCFYMRMYWRFHVR